MNLQHVIKLNRRLHEIRSITPTTIIVGKGRAYGQYRPKSGKLTVKHVLTGRFKTIKL